MTLITKMLASHCTTGINILIYFPCFVKAVINDIIYLNDFYCPD